MPETQLRERPFWHMNYIPQFPQGMHWLTFDAMKGALICRDTGTETECLMCYIIHVNAVRTLIEPGGRIICESGNREQSCLGRRGKLCATCEDRKGRCRPRWRIWVKDIETDIIYAHTLSFTASINFEKYADRLEESGRLPLDVVTSIFPEDFPRKRSGLTFRRLQFECASDGFEE